MAPNTHGLPRAARPIITAAAPVRSNSALACTASAISPLMTTGISTADTTAALMAWLAVPEYSSAAARG